MADTGRYKIVRQFFKGRKPYTIKRGLTLEQVRDHCQNPETSSSTATSAKARAYTRRYGAWFDGYAQE